MTNFPGAAFPFFRVALRGRLHAGTIYISSMNAFSRDASFVSLYSFGSERGQGRGEKGEEQSGEEMGERGDGGEEG